MKNENYKIRIKGNTFESDDENLFVIPLTKIKSWNISDLPERTMLLIEGSGMEERFRMMRMEDILILSIEETLNLTDITSAEYMRDSYTKECLFLMMKPFPGFIQKYGMGNYLLLNYALQVTGTTVIETIEKMKDFFSWIKSTVNSANQKSIQDFMKSSNIIQNNINLN